MLSLVSPEGASMVDAGGGDLVFLVLWDSRKCLPRRVFKKFCFLCHKCFFIQQKSGGTMPPAPPFAWALILYSKVCYKGSNGDEET